MTRLGEAHGVRTAAMITAMDTALGRAVGNAVDVRQAVDELGGCGPGNVRDLAIAECEAMLRLAGSAATPPKPSPTVVPWTSSATLSSSPSPARWTTSGRSASAAPPGSVTYRPVRP